MTEALILAAGLLVGAGVGWLLGAWRTRLRLAGELAELRRRQAGDESTIASLRQRTGELTGELAALRESLQHEQQTRVAAETQRDEALRRFDEQKKLLEQADQRLRDAFKALSADALKANSEEFAKRTQERLQPLGEALKRYEQYVRELEKAREAAYAKVSERLKALAETHQRLAAQTDTLVNALRRPEVKGRWGELQLRRTVELAGMSEHCDYVEQVTVSDDEQRLRPDLVVKLPGGRRIVVDAKVSTDAYLDAVAASDPEQQRQHLDRYVQAMRKHVRELTGKAYWDSLDGAVDFVIMFVPGESFFSAALEQDRGLIEEALRGRVILASPTTLIAMLRAVAYGWQQQELVENARQVSETARLLYERACKFAEHLGKLGDHLERATRAYNDAVGSWQSRMMPMGRRISELGVSSKAGEFADLRSIDIQPRALPPTEPDAAGDQ